MKYLIVDDSTNRRRALRNILVTLGEKPANIEVVPHNSEAMRALGEESYYCAFVCGLEDSTECLDLVREIRKKFSPNLNIVTVSPVCTKELVLESVQAGANGFLCHPCSAEDVENTLKKIGK